MNDYAGLIMALRCRKPTTCRRNECPFYHSEKISDYEFHNYCRAEEVLDAAAAAIEALQAEVKRLQGKLCDWCAVCPKERRRPEDCEMLSETPVMYGPSDAKMEVQE